MAVNSRTTSFFKGVAGLLAAAAITVPMTVAAVPIATSVDGTFSLTANADIFNATTVPHTTVNGSLATNNSVAWYSFTGIAGATVYFDHDGGTSNTLVNSIFSLFRSSGELVAYGDDSGPLDAGSPSLLNAFLGVYTLPASDTYYLAVTSSVNTPVFGCAFAAMTRPDGNVTGGYAASGCPDRTFGFSNGGQSAGTFTVHISNSAPAGVPEPGTLALLGLGLAGLAASRRRKQ